MPELVENTPSVAMVIATEILGGHEFQARCLADDLAKLCRLTIYLNQEEHRSVFDSVAAEIEVHPALFHTPGWLGTQVLHGVQNRKPIQALFKKHDHILVSAGTVEASVCSAVAFHAPARMSLYLPFFYDRAVLWGKLLGGAYNLLLSCFGPFFHSVITINHIQARLIRGFMHRPTRIVPNRIQDLPPATRKNDPPRLLCICRLDRQKRVPELLRWLDFAETPFREILILGDGPEKDSLLRISSSLQHVQIKFLGWKSPAEQSDLIGAQDVLIMNSFIEGEPLVIREANARGITVLARNIPGVRGVTKKRNRFNTQQELREALLNLPPLCTSPSTSRSQRERLVYHALQSMIPNWHVAEMTGRYL